MDLTRKSKPETLYKNLIIMTGIPGEGKTTFLKRAAGKLNAGGILQPVINYKRCIEVPSQNILFPIETTMVNDDNVHVGKFVFMRKAFVRALNILEEHAKRDFPIIFIDEYGLLEMRDRGMEPDLSELLPKLIDSHKVLIVVRSMLLDDFMEKFGLDPEKTLVIEYERDRTNFDDFCRVTGLE